MKRKENFQWLPKELHQLKYEAISVPQGSVRLVKRHKKRKSSTCYLLITNGVTSSSPVPLKTRRERERVKQAKYYAFLLDCTRDISRVEQMSIILRFCNSSTGAMEEHFVGFIAFAEATGEYITNSILQELERNGLDIQNCRGQGYGNGANMVGINKGVRTRILNINPRAFFTPCEYHSWNLLLIDAANSSATAKTFFDFINKNLCAVFKVK
ncbi:zinc finger MYM-type protein 1 [Trichonephila clavipes]|nr:zinc finger MYM-type protein 1 [Trichonephila clavipes]